MNRASKPLPTGLGAAFFPEQQEERDWQAYVEQMADSGLSFARIGEFAWDLIEKDEGVYDFSWLDRVLELLDRHGLKAILCTPCAAPPVWMGRRYDFYPTLFHGEQLKGGTRQQFCINSASYRRMAFDVVRAMGEHYARDSRIAAWQLDNEIGYPICCCPRCLAEFRDFCRRRFGTPQTMNDALHLHFWSQSLNSFDDIFDRSQLKHPALHLVYRDFYSETLIRHYRTLAEILRETGADAPISTNYMITWSSFDHEVLCEKALDYSAGDLYWPCRLFSENIHQILFAAAFLRGLNHGGNFAFNEYEGKAAAPGRIRYYTLAAFAAGASYANYFRWDCDLSGQERDSSISCRPEEPGRAQAEIAAVARELAGLDLPDTPRPAARCAFLYSFESQFDLSNVPPQEPELAGPYGNGYAMLIARHMKALLELGEAADLIFPGGDFKRHQIIIAPALRILSGELAERIRDYVKNGGCFLMLPYSGILDANGTAFRNGAPGPLADLFGMSTVDAPVLEEAVRFTSAIFPEFELREPDRAEELIVKDAEAVACYSNGFTAMTRRGKAWYMGAFPKDPTAFYREFLKINGIVPEEAEPDTVRLIRGKYVFHFNTRNYTCSIQERG